METTSANQGSKELPSDEELAAMLARSTGKGGKPKRDPNLPSPRLPEAAYYYLFILFEAAILMGVWGFMRMGIDEALKGPTIEAPVLDQLEFHIKSIGIGFVEVLANQFWIPAGCMLLSLPVFMPVTPKSRKRMASILSTVLMGVFIMLIAFQFADDMAAAGSAQF